MLRKNSMVLLSLMLCLCFGIATYAGDIRYVRIETNQSPAVGKVDINSVCYEVMRGQPYTMSKMELENRAGYQLGDIVRIRFQLTAEEDSAFVDIKPAACLVDNSIPASSAEIRDGGRSLALDYELPAVHVKLEKPKNLMLTEDGLASWDKVELASGYSVRIQKMNNTGGRDIVRVEKTDKNYLDISEYMFAEEGDYLYSVEAESDEYYIDSSDYAALAVNDSVLVSQDDIGEDASILDDGAGKANHNGAYVNNRELKIEGQWYFFGSDGIWISGWREDALGWKYYDPKTHKRARGITWIGDKEYYLDYSNGYMQTGAVETPEGEAFYGTDGARAFGWVNYKGETYYINADGSKNSNMLIDSDNRTYIFYKDGRLAKSSRNWY